VVPVRSLSCFAGLACPSGVTAAMFVAPGSGSCTGAEVSLGTPGVPGPNPLAFLVRTPTTGQYWSLPTGCSVYTRWGTCSTTTISIQTLSVATDYCTPATQICVSAAGTTTYQADKGTPPGTPPPPITCQCYSPSPPSCATSATTALGTLTARKRDVMKTVQQEFLEWNSTHPGTIPAFAWNIVGL